MFDSRCDVTHKHVLLTYDSLRIQFLCVLLQLIEFACNNVVKVMRSAVFVLLVAANVICEYSWYWRLS